MYVWDYKLKKNWKPKGEGQWIWYLTRKINFDDFKGIKKTWIKKFWPKLTKHLDPAKRRMLELYFKEHD